MYLVYSVVRPTSQITSSSRLTAVVFSSTTTPTISYGRRTSATLPGLKVPTKHEKLLLHVVLAISGQRTHVSSYYIGPLYICPRINAFIRLCVLFDLNPYQFSRFLYLCGHHTQQSASHRVDIQWRCLCVALSKHLYKFPCHVSQLY